MPENFSDLLTLGLELLKSNNFRAVAALLIFVGVKYLGPLLTSKVPFFGTGKGKATLVILLSIANGLFQAFKPGAVPSMAMLGDCIMAAVSAAGGYSLFKPFTEKTVTAPSLVK